MAVAASDLLVPKGPVDSKLFPGLESRDLSTRMDGYIARALDEPEVIALSATKDRAVKARALYFVFYDVVLRLANEPAHIDVAEEGGHTYNIQQLATMKELRDGYLAEYLDLIVPAATQSASPLPGTRSVRTRQVW